MAISRKRGTPAQGVQIGDHNRQWNFFAPVALNFFGEFERLQDACFDPTPLARDLDLDRFTGRDWLIEQIDAFVKERRRGYVIIRAEAGVGKSTLAAYLVRTRPWLHHFTRLPGGRSPAVARKNLAAQLIRRWDLLDEWAPEGILPSASGQPHWFANLLAAAAAKRDATAKRDEGEPRPIVIVVDGLDEADAEGMEPDGLPLGLPTSLPDGVFVVATSRFGIERALYAVKKPHDWLQIEVEGPDNLADMRRFIEEVTAQGGGDSRLIDALGRAEVDPDWFRVTMAESCAGVWIYLRYVLDEIRDGTMDPRSIGRLPGDLAGYYAEQVQRWRGGPEDEAAQHRWEHVRMPLLGVLAAARAPLTAAELAAFAGVQSQEATRRFVTETVRPFLNCSGEGQREASRYALRHQSLRDLLSGNVPADRPDLIDLADVFATQARTANQRIASALVPPGSPQERDWHGAGSYARQNLAAHADCELLDDLLRDPGFLLVTDPGTLLARRASLRTPDSKRALEAFRLGLDGKKTSTDAERRSTLARNAARVQATSLLAACAERSGNEWPIRWTAWAGQGHLSLPGDNEYVRSVAIGRAGDRDVVISCSSGGSVRIWDAVTGHLIGEPRAFARTFDRGPWGRGLMDSVTLDRVADRYVVISCPLDGGSVRIWDAVTGHLIGEHTFPGGRVGMVSHGRVGDRNVLVTQSGSLVTIRDAVTGESVQELCGCFVPVDDLLIGRVGDRDVVITREGNDWLRIWDAVTGELLGEPLDGRCGSAITGLVIDRVRDRDVLVIGTSNALDESEIQICDAATSHPAGDPLAVEKGWMSAMAMGRAGNRAVIIAVFNEPDSESDGDQGPGADFPLSKLRIWDAATGHPIGKPLIIEGGNVGAITTGPAGGQDIIVTGSEDGTVRIWDATEEALVGHTGSVGAVTFGQVDGQDVIVSYSHQDRTARVWDVITGHLLQDPRTFKLSPKDEYAVALGRISDREVIVGVSDGESELRILDPITGNPIREPVALEEDEKHHVKVTIGHIGGRGVIVTTAAIMPEKGFATEGLIRIRDADTGDLLREPFIVSFDIAATVALGRARDRDLILIGGDGRPVEILDAVTGHRISEIRTDETMVCALTTGRLGDRDVFVAGLGIPAVRIWDAVTGEPIGEPLLGHDRSVLAVALGRVGGRDLIVSGSDDRTVVLREHRLL